MRGDGGGASFRSQVPSLSTTPSSASPVLQVHPRHHLRAPGTAPGERRHPPDDRDDQVIARQLRLWRLLVSDTTTAIAATWWPWEDDKISSVLVDEIFGFLTMRSSDSWWWNLLILDDYILWFLMMRSSDTWWSDLLILDLRYFCGTDYLSMMALQGFCKLITIQWLKLF